MKFLIMLSGLPIGYLAARLGLSAVWYFTQYAATGRDEHITRFIYWMLGAIVLTLAPFFFTPTKIGITLEVFTIIITMMSCYPQTDVEAPAPEPFYGVNGEHDRL